MTDEEKKIIWAYIEQGEEWLESVYGKPVKYSSIGFRKPIITLFSRLKMIKSEYDETTKNIVFYKNEQTNETDNTNNS